MNQPGRGRHRAGSRPRWGRVAGWLPRDRISRRLFTISFIDSVGTGLFLASSALFFTRTLGLTSPQVGVGLSLAGLAGLACQVPLGRLADRIGGLRALVAIQMWRGIGFFAYPFIAGFPTFLVVACLLGVGEWAVGPIVQAVVGAAEEGPSKVRTMAAMTMLRNVGFAIGALLATLVISARDPHAYRLLVFANAASFVAAPLMLVRLPVGAASGARAGFGAAGQDDKAAVRVRDLRYLLLAGLNGVLYLHTVLLTVGLPLWVATRTHAPRILVGALVMVNTVLAMGLQVRLSCGADEVRPAAARQRRAGASLAVCCLLVAVTARSGPGAVIALMLAATAALTFGEIWQSAGAWGLSYGLSPPARRSYYLSVYHLGSTGATVVGPALVTAAVMPAGAMGWLALAAVFALAGLAVPVVARSHSGAAARVPVRQKPDRLRPRRQAPHGRLRRGRESERAAGQPAGLTAE